MLVPQTEVEFIYLHCSQTKTGWDDSTSYLVRVNQPVDPCVNSEPQPLRSVDTDY